MRRLFAVLLLAGAALGQGVGGTSSGVAASNVLPNMVSVGAVNSIGAGTTFTIPPPGSIVPGNPLLAVLAVAGQSTETWTPPAGFTQIGSNVTNASGDKITLAVFCKTAASESGNYVFTFNNGASGIGVAVVLQLSGTTCTPEATLTATANAAILTVASFATNNANDLLIPIAVHTNGNPTTNLSSPGTVTQQVQNNGLFIGSYPNGNGSTPAFNFVSYVTATPNTAGSTNAFAGFVLAFSPSVTSTTVPFTANSSTAASASGGQNITGGVQASGPIQAQQFAIQNGVVASSPANSYAVQLNTGALVPGIGVNNANNLCIDCGERLGFVQVGNGIKNSAKLFLTAYTIEGISQDNSQDLFIAFLDASDNLWIGCPTAACTGSTLEKDVKINVQTGQVGHLDVNASDVCTWNGTTLNCTGVQVNSVQVPGIVCSNVTPVTVSANVATDQNLMTCTVAAGALNSANRVMQVQAAGVYSTPAASTSTVTLKAKLCTVSGCGSGTVLTLFNQTSTALGAVQATNNPFSLSLMVTTQTAGASAAFEAHGAMTIDVSALASAAEAVFADNNTATIGTIDSTAQTFLQITIAFSNASGSNSATQRQGTSWTLN